MIFGKEHNKILDLLMGMDDDFANDYASLVDCLALGIARKCKKEKAFEIEKEDNTYRFDLYDNGEAELMIYKDPKTDGDSLKKSHKGLVFVERDGDNFKVTDGLLYETYLEYQQTHQTALRPVFINGNMYNRESFTTIRKRLENEK